MFPGGGGTETPGEGRQGPLFLDWSISFWRPELLAYKLLEARHSKNSGPLIVPWDLHSASIIPQHLYQPPARGYLAPPTAGEDTKSAVLFSGESLGSLYDVLQIVSVPVVAGLIVSHSHTFPQ